MRLKQIYRLLPRTKKQLREGPLADLPASPHGSLNLVEPPQDGPSEAPATPQGSLNPVGPAIQAAAPDQEVAQTENLSVDLIEGPRLSVVIGMSYAPGDNILDTARDDIRLEQSRDDTARQASRSGQTASSAPLQQPADDCIVTNWKARSTLRTGPGLIDTLKTLDPEWSPPPPAPRSAFSSSSSSGNDDDEAPCPQNFQDMPEDGEPEAGDTVEDAATEHAVVGAAAEEAAEQGPVVSIPRTRQEKMNLKQVKQLNMHRRSKQLTMQRQNKQRNRLQRLQKSQDQSYQQEQIQKKKEKIRLAKHDGRSMTSGFFTLFCCFLVPFP